ncbi:hypothetical protein Q0590_30635 [Rhodocytophaga aerolata]|uniref:Uncharacterized protein n=1 Tax=Rhodocytophaga aerolata TaxID=455078 RepID=A0ABT8RIP1_9BACT|nr:hypothetical protein [Rhodocytophaga aerolata]MDO1450670.1 hypothetical protein [Rhodocytophaga aerolata]
MNYYSKVNNLLYRHLTDKCSTDEQQIHLQQCICLVAGFRERIKGYSKEDLMLLKKSIRAYLTIEQDALIHKDYLHQIESQLKSMSS